MKLMVLSLPDNHVCRFIRHVHGPQSERPPDTAHDRNVALHDDVNVAKMRSAGGT